MSFIDIVNIYIVYWYWYQNWRTLMRTAMILQSLAVSRSGRWGTAPGRGWGRGTRAWTTRLERGTGISASRSKTVYRNPRWTYTYKWVFYNFPKVWREFVCNGWSRLQHWSRLWGDRWRVDQLHQRQQSHGWHRPGGRRHSDLQVREVF